MSAIPSNQPGPLTWVKPEIDFALERVRTGLERYFEDSVGNHEALSGALASVREVTGALQIIGVDAPGTLSAEIDAVITALAARELEPTRDLAGVLQRAGICLEKYLNGLMRSEDPAPMMLRPSLMELAEVRGSCPIDDRVLFCPDLNVYPPPLAGEALLAGSDLAEVVRQQRACYQRGMLGWLRGSADGLSQMRDALRAIEHIQPAPERRAPWWVATAFVEALLLQGLAASDETKRAASRIDRCLAGLASGAPAIDELMRELLFHLTRCTAVSPLVAEVRSLFQLDRYLAAAPMSAIPHIDAEHVEILVQRVKELAGLDTLSGPVSERSKEIESSLFELRGLLNVTQREPVTQLIDAMLTAATGLVETDSELSRAILHELATAARALEGSLKGRSIGIADTTSEFDMLRARLLAFVPGSTPHAVARVGDEDRALLQAVAKEISSTLQEVEHSLDAFFRQQVPSPALTDLPGLIRSVTGPLELLGVEAVAQLLHRCASIITTLDHPELDVSEEEMVLLAEGLSSVTLFVRSLDRDNRNELRAVETVLARFDARVALHGASSTLDLQTAADDTREGITELDFELTSAEGRSECSHTADITGAEISDILEQFDLSALDDDSRLEPIGQGLGTAHPGKPCPAGSTSGAPSESKVVEVDARAEGIDPEIVSVFLEEANELLQGMGEVLQLASTQPDDSDSLTTLRRIFHTLKGSGRMAGLLPIGDAAWTIESVLNEWLEAARPASQDLLALLEFARKLFTGWINDLAARGCTAVQVGVLADAVEGVKREMDGQCSVNSDSATTEDTGAALALPDMATGATTATPAAVLTGRSSLPAPLLRIFVQEAQQHVETIRSALADIASGKDGEVSERLFRAAHSLAGIARTAGLEDITFTASVIEDAPVSQSGSPKTLETLHCALANLHALVEAVAEGRQPQLAPEVRAQLERSGDLFDGHAAINASVDTAQEQTEKPEDLPLSENGPRVATEPGGLPPSVPDRRALKDDVDQQLLPVFLDEVRDLTPLIGEGLRHLRDDPADAATFDALRRILHTIKGGARMVGAIRLGELVHIMEGRVEEAVECGSMSADALDLLEAEFDRLSSGFETLECGERELSRTVEHHAEDPPDLEQGPHEVHVFSAHIRVAVDAVDRLLDQTGEVSISRGRIEAEARTFKQSLMELADSVARLRDQLKEIEIHAESRLQATPNAAGEHGPVFDPLELDRFTRFQELTRLMAESLHDVNTVQQHLVDSLDEVQAALSFQSGLNRALLDDLMRLRTVTFQSLGERLRRVARQAARETGKKVELQLTGGQTEVDRGVLERMAAPLEHLVRNAVIHGIELPEERMRQGKPESGAIRLTLRQETGSLLIELADDGRGIDHQRIYAKAIELGWLDRDARPSRSDLERIMLRSGFSTATVLTELAGRGVGLDVVATEVHALGGNLEIASEDRRGTTFTMRVPLTLAVAKALLVCVGGRHWAILSNIVEQVQNLGAGPVVQNQALEWHGHHYPLFRLSHLLGERDSFSSDGSGQFALLIRSGDRRVAVRVDDLAVNQDIVLKAIGPQLAGLPGVTGASVLPDGEVIFVINPALLMERQQTDITPLPETDHVLRPPSPLIMVVDDSLTVRNVTSRLLTRSGYRVVTARDGIDALQQIQQSPPDALLVDIEMPRMDGFELTKNLKASQRTSKLPIIMITSRLAPKHRDYARLLGVDVYLGKPYEEEELLSHLSNFTASPFPV